MRKIILFSFLLCEIAEAFSQVQKDTIFLTNGTVVIGKIKKIKVGVVTFDPDDANDITVNLPKIKGIAATRTVFRIETTNDKVYFGQLIPGSRNLYSHLIHDKDTTELYLQDISMVYPFKSSFFQRFSGNVGLGFTYTRSSDFGQLNFNSKLNYLAKKEELSLSTSGTYSLTDSTFSRDREEVSLKNNFYFSPTWFATLSVGYQKNLELGLERRFQEGMGIGNKYITSKHVYAWARSGFVLNQEKSVANVTSGTLAELLGELEFNFFRFTKPQVNFVLSESFYYSLSEKGRIRNDAEGDLYWEIIKDLKLDLTIYSNYDSKSPGTDTKKVDFGIVFGLNFTF